MNSFRLRKHKTLQLKKAYEVLLPLRPHDGGRGALLQQVRAQLRREALSAPAPKLARRGGLCKVRQPRAVHAAAEDSAELAIVCSARTTRAWTHALLRIALSRYRAAPLARGAAGLGRSRSAALLSLVDVEQAPRLVPGSAPCALGKEGSQR